MPAAAALALKKLPGMAHCEGYAATIPANAIEKNANANGTPTACIASAASAPPASTRGIAVCHRRSPVRSECHPFHSITGIANAAGIAESMVVSNVVNPSSRCSIFGSHKLNP
jgi:hypothetical protein